jgi:hypothetical protein
MDPVRTFIYLGMLWIHTDERSKVLTSNVIYVIGKTEGLAKPTPFYLSGITEDMLVQEISLWLQDGFSKYTALKDRVCLAKVRSNISFLAWVHRERSL